MLSEMLFENILIRSQYCIDHLRGEQHIFSLKQFPANTFGKVKNLTCPFERYIV